MNRASRRSRNKRRQTKDRTDQPETKAASDTSPPRNNATRLLVILVFGAALIVVAVLFRNRVDSNPLLRIPPIETRDLLPAVAKTIEQMQAEIVKDPNSAKPWGEYGLVLLAHGFRKEAGACFREAEELDPADYRWPYYLGMTMGVWDADESLEAFQRAVKKAPTRLSVRLRLAEWSFDLRKLDQCERETQLALEQDPDSPRAQAMMARLLFQRGDAEASLKWAQQAAGSPQGDRRDVHELLARIQQRLGNSDAAADEVKRAEKLPRGVTVWDDPEMGMAAMYLRDATILNTQAEIHLARGDREQQLRRLRQVVKSEPNNVLWKEKLATALTDAEQYDEAIKLLDEALNQHGNSSMLAFQRGQVHFILGEMDEAQQFLQQAVDLKPDYDEAHALLGRSLLRVGEYEKAVAALREAVRLNPNSAEAHDGLAQAYMSEKNSDEALRNWRRAVRLAPQNVEIRIRLAELLLAKNNRQDAIDQLQEAEKAAPESARVKQLLKQCRTVNE